jgi:hypothetical protein
LVTAGFGPSGYDPPGFSPTQRGIGASSSNNGIAKQVTLATWLPYQDVPLGAGCCETATITANNSINMNWNYYRCGLSWFSLADCTSDQPGYHHLIWLEKQACDECCVKQCAKRYPGFFSLHRARCITQCKGHCLESERAKMYAYYVCCVLPEIDEGGI